MIKDKLVSIVTPTYNSEGYIVETIRSVQNQTFSNWERLRGIPELKRPEEVIYLSWMQMIYGCQISLNLVWKQWWKKILLLFFLLINVLMRI